MEEIQKIQVSKTALVAKYALITAAILIVYFLIMAALGLVKYSALRVINYPLIAITLFLAIKELKSKNSENKVGYLEGFGTGFMIVLFTAMIFGLFIFIYARILNPAFINQIWPDPYSTSDVANSVAIALYIFAETIIFGLILTFILMQYFKRDDGSAEAEE